MKSTCIRVLVTLILMFSLSYSILGVSATYVPEPAIVLKKKPGVFSHPNMFGAKLGRLTITSDEVMYNPTIMVTGLSGSYDIYLIGPHRWDKHNDWDYDKKIQMNLLAVSYTDGTDGSAFIRALNGKQPLLDGEDNVQVDESPFVVDLYLVNSNDHGGTTDTGMAPNLNTNGGFFKLDSPFVFETPIDFRFTVGITDTLGQGPWVFPASGEPTQGQFIPIDGAVGQGSTSVINPGSYTDGEPQDVGFWYGTGTPQQVYFNLYFENPSVTFDLCDAYDGYWKELTDVCIEVGNGKPHKKYKLNIAFTTDDNSGEFQLLPDFIGGTGIPFELMLDEGPVAYGDNIEWRVSGQGLNRKSLFIGGIDASLIDQLVSGVYQVTIFVNITNAD
ncbi:MAG: hypothetical protein WC136_08755 [Sphaerochaeta sp.]